jgi:hypothetical protein
MPMPSSIGNPCPVAEQLRNRYCTFQQSAKLPKRLAVKASPPLLVFPHEKWGSAKSKVLIVGQETLRWQYNPDEIGDSGHPPIENFRDFLQAEHGVGAMWRLYRWYALGRAYPKQNSPFWRGFRALSLAIGGCEDSALWTNVFKVNVRGSVMDCNAAEISALRRAQEGLLRHEITHLKPDVVVFLSGPRYDSTIQHDFPDMEISQFSRRLPRSSVGLVRAAGLPTRTIRTFHPEYLQRSNQLGILAEISRWATTG